MLIAGYIATTELKVLRVFMYTYVNVIPNYLYIANLSSLLIIKTWYGYAVKLYLPMDVHLP